VAFDTTTRNELQKLVGRARDLLVEEFTSQCQGIYGIQPDGTALDISSLGHLSEEARTRAELLRDRVNHLAAGIAGSKKQAEAVARMLREQAFTVLNRICALRMCEERELVQECVRKGYESKGFRLYDQAAVRLGGDTYSRYGLFLQLLFDELAVDLGVLFDRFSLYGLLFPRENTLKELLQLINSPALAHIWAEDETIGWVYQYFNSQEERQAMRKASIAPRNSRELAVRNQFFTPRYVVEFLTDNTLGRIWYEMQKGDTDLTDTCRYLIRRPTELFLKSNEIPPEGNEDEAGLSEDDRLKLPEFVTHREKRDPRDLKVLDPACGSGHFLLYAFDLLETIYREAWEDHDSPKSEATGSNLLEDYASLDELQNAIPEMILRWNLHGVDIDPRATQIAALSLWLRAQRAWQGQGLKANERPQVRKSNIVCAEPMPGENDLLRDFTSRLKPTVLGQLFEVVFDRMELAGEAGSLLRIEEEIQTAIDAARVQWLAGPKPDQEELFHDTARPKQREIRFDFTGVSGESFWTQAEEKILNSLREYADDAQGTEGLGRRLFVEDAAQGFAFVDLCRKCFDVVLMNPPFGEPTKRCLPLVQKQYPISKKNLYIAFIERAASILAPLGRVGCISDRTYVTHTRYTEFRHEYALSEHGKLNIVALLDHGWGVLDSYVQTASAIFSKADLTNSIVCVDLKKIVNPEYALEKALTGELHAGEVELLHLHSRSTLRHLPKEVLAFWVIPEVISAFASWTTLDPFIAESRSGLSSSDNKRFYKLVWEVPRDSIGVSRRWSYLSNGGEPFPFFRPQVYVIDYEKDGYMVKALAKQLYQSETRTIKNQPYYRRNGLSYGKRTEKFSIQVLPKDQLFSNEGHSLFFGSDKDIWTVCGYLNSDIISYVLNSIAGLHKESGYVGSLPFPLMHESDSRSLQKSGLLGYTVVRDAFREIPETQYFDVVSLFQEGRVSSLHKIEQLQVELDIVSREINSHVNSFYKIGKESLSKIPSRSWSLVKSLYSCNSCEEAAYVRAVDFVNTLVGFCVGRWDIRYTDRSQEIPELPGAFEPLPICSPGMLQNEDGIPAAPDEIREDYPLRITWSGILVDDGTHEDDIINRIGEASLTIWGEGKEVIDQEICQLLNVRSLREYFQSPSKYFADHIKRYSKSNRKAPIYWPLSSESGIYTLWIYYPRITNQTLYSCVNDFIDPKLKEIELDLDRFRGSGEVNSKQQKMFDGLVDLERELKTMREELLRVAKLPYKPNQNDGVMITAAPLWRLFRHMPWQKELRKYWDGLKTGKYDWAHLAYAIWPDRVREVCKKDKSIAIAHDLEDLCE